MRNQKTISQAGAATGRVVSMFMFMSMAVLAALLGGCYRTHYYFTRQNTPSVAVYSGFHHIWCFGLVETGEVDLAKMCSTEPTHIYSRLSAGAGFIGGLQPVYTPWGQTIECSTKAGHSKDAKTKRSRASAVNDAGDSPDTAAVPESGF